MMCKCNTGPRLRDITDPEELAQARLDEVRAGNAAMREQIKNYRAVLRAGVEAEKQLKAELKEIRNES